MPQRYTRRDEYDAVGADEYETIVQMVLAVLVGISGSRPLVWYIGSRSLGFAEATGFTPSVFSNTTDRMYMVALLLKKQM